MSDKIVDRRHRRMAGRPKTCGRLAPLRRAQCPAQRGRERKSSWAQDGACPGGGLCIGHDPNTNLVQLLMGTGGPLLLTDTVMTKPLFKAVHDRWTKIRKSSEAAAFLDEDG